MTVAYGDTHGGGTVAFVEPGSPAEKAGIAPGDRLATADGCPLRDILDWQWASADLEIDVETVSAGGARHTVHMERDPGESFGLTFTDALFDGVRTCRNDCAFCFMWQLPKGLRKPLYLRDDDYRLSFLYGNFVTLTNLDGQDVERIVEQRLSPLYVSLHAVDQDVRSALVCARGEDRAVEVLDELLDAGIEAHVQIVLLPGLNDGDVLQDTLRWLAERAGVLSVGVVPLGYTAHQERFGRSYEDPRDAADALDALEPWRSRMADERGVRWVYAADEFYLAAGRAVPPWDAYDGFPQYENGIGLVRAFVDEFAESAQAIAEAGAGSRPDVRAPVTLVTGELFAPVLAGLLPAIAAPTLDLRVMPVRNALFGGNVTVAGLLAGQDVVSAVSRDAGTGTYLVPAVMVNSDGSLLDDVAAKELGRRSGKDVRLVPEDAEAFLGWLFAGRSDRTGTGTSD